MKLWKNPCLYLTFLILKISRLKCGEDNYRTQSGSCNTKSYRLFWQQSLFYEITSPYNTNHRNRKYIDKLRNCVFFNRHLQVICKFGVIKYWIGTWPLSLLFQRYTGHSKYQKFLIPKWYIITTTLIEHQEDPLTRSKY